MHVLLTDASRDGAADAVAERIAERLRARGLTVHQVPIEQVDDIEAHDAVVVGGDASGTHWLRPARRFVQRHEEDLARRPVWLYSSAAAVAGSAGSAGGPGGAAGDADAPVAAPRPQEFDVFHALVEPEDEAVFVARVADPRRWAGWLGHVRRLLGGRTPPRGGTVVDPAAVDAWADGIADRLVRLHQDRAIDDVHEMVDEGPSGG